MSLADVIIPRRQVEVLRYLVMVEAVEPAHHVGGDELSWRRILANRIELIFLVAAPSIADETFPAQQQAWVARLGFNGNLVPVAVSLAPVRSGPAGIQVIERAVAIFQPCLEVRACLRIERDLEIFVIDLPADHIRIVSEALRHAAGDVAGQLTIFRIVPIELLAIAMFFLATILVGAQRLWIFLRQPGGWRCSGRAKHGVDAALSGFIDGAFQPVKFVVAFGRLHRAPCKFADADEMDPGFLHQIKIDGPARLRPALRIPGSTEQYRWRWWSCVSCRFRYVGGEFGLACGELRE